jgi:hypothetical protein
MIFMLAGQTAHLLGFVGLIAQLQPRFVWIHAAIFEPLPLAHALAHAGVAVICGIDFQGPLPWMEDRVS